ncbi:hypothetical protein DEO72_LG7g1178 [Vigna unguiculata]|uniref:Uncharacterized protein n=1 Tax=Vigna unguiculata TaxID=3917 RepID=A0A4D6MH78_VIGUN|nr:hypothetical protein DEO72_LG7g1178 [Vigna unguiculata]
MLVVLLQEQMLLVLPQEQMLVPVQKPTLSVILAIVIILCHWQAVCWFLVAFEDNNND